MNLSLFLPRFGLNACALVIVSDRSPSANRPLLPIFFVSVALFIGAPIAESKTENEQAAAAVDAEPEDSTRKTRKLLGAVETYEKNGRLSDAKVLLDATLSDAPPVEESKILLRLEAAERLETIEKAIASGEENRLKTLAQQLEIAEDEAERQTLVAILRKALEAETTKTNVELSAHLQRAVENSENRRIRAMPEMLRAPARTVLDASEKATRVLLEVLIYFVFLLIALFGFRLIRNNLVGYRGVGLELVDEAGTSQSDAESERASRELNMLFAHEVKSIERGGSVAIQVAGLADEPVTASMIGQVAKLETLIDDTPVKVGVISFSPRQLFALLGSLFSPQHEFLLQGSLTHAHGMTSLSLTKRSPAGTPVAGEQYYASAHGENARELVVRDVATQFALKNAKFAVTSEPRSLRALLESEELLRKLSDSRQSSASDDSNGGGETRYDLLEQSLAALRTSLRYDPANWMARFNAGLLLRQMGRWDEGYEQFDLLRRMLASPSIKDSKDYASFTSQNPDFGWTVSYNLTLCLAEADTLRRNRHALKEVKNLIVDSTPAPWWMRNSTGSRVAAVKPRSKFTNDAANLKAESRAIDQPDIDAAKLEPDQRRKMALTRSARAVACMTRIELLKWSAPSRRKSKNTRDRQIGNLLKQVEADEQWIWGLIDKGVGGDWQAYARAHSVALNALGRTHYLVGNYHDALKYLRWAVRLHAREGFAGPFVNLASLIITRNTKYSVDWAHQASELLNSALRINPDHTKAHHLLGIIYSDTSVADYEQAKKEFALARDHWSSLAHHARILFEHDGKCEEAMRELKKSLGYESKADNRAVLFCQIVEQMYKDGAGDKRLLKQGLMWATRLEKQGESKWQREKGEGFRESFSQLLATLKGNSTSPSV